MINFVVWCLLSFISKKWGLRPFLTFGLGEGCSSAGMAVGYALNYYGLLELIQDEGGNIIAPFAAALIVPVVVCVVFIFTEKDFDSLLALSDARVLDLKAMLLHSHALAAKREDRPWLGACEVVGKRAMLSKREQELLVELSRNRTLQEIADHLCITVATVRTHTHRVYSKLGVHSRSQLIELVRAEYKHLVKD